MKTNTPKLILLLLFFYHSSSAQNFDWAKQFIGKADGASFSVKEDAAGYVYTTGNFSDTTDFDPGPGNFNLISGGIADAFIAKLNPAGNFVWARRISGVFLESGLSLDVDAASNVYVSGVFQSTVDFDPGIGIYNLTAAGGLDIFILKLDGAGNFVWAKAMGGSGLDYGNSISVNAGYVYAAGSFEYTADFDPDTGNYNLTSSGYQDIFISKLDTDGKFIWAAKAGGADLDRATSIFADPAGNVYATGGFSGLADFDPDSTLNYNLTATGTEDIFILKLDSSGHFAWVKQLGGNNNAKGSSIKLDASGNIYTTGLFSGIADFDPDPTTSFNLVSTDSLDIFISKLDSAGNFIWAKNVGGVHNDYGSCVAVDAVGNVFTTGVFIGVADFDPNAGTYNLTSAGSQDMFISKLDASGNFLWAKQMGGAAFDNASSIDVGVTGNLLVTGYFAGLADLNPNAAIFNLNAGSGNDIFIVKLSNVTTSVLQDFAEKDFNIYPNPTSGRVNIEWEKDFTNAKVTVRNVIGQEIFAKKYSTTHKIEINIEQAPGIYFVEVKTDKELPFVFKVIRE